MKETGGFLLDDLLKRGLSEDKPVADAVPMSTAAPDAFPLDAITPESHDLDQATPNSVDPSSPSGPRTNSRDRSSSDEEWPPHKQMEDESGRAKPKDTEREKTRSSVKLKEKAGEPARQLNGQEMTRGERSIKSPPLSGECRVKERRLEKRAGSLEETLDEKEQKRGERRKNKRQHRRDLEKEMSEWKSASGAASASAVTPSSQEVVLSDNQVRWCSNSSSALFVTLSVLC